MEGGGGKKEKEKEKEEEEEDEERRRRRSPLRSIIIKKIYIKKYASLDPIEKLQVICEIYKLCCTI